MSYFAYPVAPFCCKSSGDTSILCPTAILPAKSQNCLLAWTSGLPQLPVRAYRNRSVVHCSHLVFVAGEGGDAILLSEPPFLAAEGQALQSSIAQSVANYIRVHYLPLFPTTLQHTTQGLGWMMAYLKGSCKDYGFRFPSDSAPSLGEVLQYAAHSADFRFDAKASQPLKPLPFLLSLLPTNAPPVCRFSSVACPLF
jgi:hypothetical protein